MYGQWWGLKGFFLCLEITLSKQILQTYASLLEAEKVPRSLSQGVLMEKIIAKHETNDFVFSYRRVCIFPSFEWKKTKEQIAERRNLLDI